MRTLAILTVFLVALAAGCKDKKSNPPDQNPQVNPQGDPKQGNPQQTGTPGGNTGNPGVGVIPSGGAGGGVAVNTGGGGGGGGGVMMVRKAARRVQAQNEMKTLGLAITELQNDLGRMPTKDEITTALKQYPKVLEAVNEGSFILTGTNQAGGLWAYEIDSETIGGFALIGGVANRATAADVKRYLGQN